LKDYRRVVLSSMWHARAGAALAACALSAHTAYVYRERVHKAPRTPVALRFSPGSEDAWLEGTLRSGDVLLFSRDCALYGACGALACAARQAATGPYDHAAVVVLLRQEPHVLERTASGARLRPFAARLRASRARSVLLRRLEAPLSAAEAAAGAAFAARVAAPAPRLPGDSAAAALADPRAAARALREAARAAAGDARGCSAELVGEFFAAVGRPSPDVALRALREGGGWAAAEFVRDLPRL
jgi:hypothetical protein